MARAGIDKDLIGRQNEAAFEVLRLEYETLGSKLSRRGVDIETIKAKAALFEAAAPSRGAGGAGASRFQTVGEPRNVLDRLDDCAVVNQLTGATPRVSLHIPSDLHDDPAELADYAGARGLSFEAIHSSTFEDTAGQKLSYRFGSLSHIDPAVRSQAIEQNVACIRLGRALGCKALTIKIGDGFDSPGRSHFTRLFERMVESIRAIRAELPDDWRLYIEEKDYERLPHPAAAPDFGTGFLVANALGERTLCVVELNAHADGANAGVAVAKLIHFEKLGGLHFQVADLGKTFLVLNELVDAELSGAPGFAPAYMIGRSANLGDPIESMMVSAMEIQRGYVQAHLVDRELLSRYQEENDPVMADEVLRQAFRTDVQPILAMARLEKDAAVDPLATYRASGYREKVGAARPRAIPSGGGVF